MLLEREDVAVNVPLDILVELAALAKPGSPDDHAVLAEARRWIAQAQEQAQSLMTVRQLWHCGGRRL